MTNFKTTMNGLIAEIAKGYGDVRGKVQEAALMVLDHAREHNDVSFAGNPTGGLMNAIPSRLRSDLADWFGRFSPVHFVKNDSGAIIAKMRKDTSTAYVPFDMDGARANPWWERPVEEDKEPTTISREDFVKELINLSARYRRILAGESRANVILGFDPTEDLKAVDRLVSRLKGANDDQNEEGNRGTATQMAEQAAAKPKASRRKSA